MIEVQFGPIAGRGITFRWSCSTCHVDDQAFEEDEGIDTIVWHLRKYHARAELVRIGAILTKGMAAAAKASHLPDPEYGSQVDRIAEAMIEYFTGEPEFESVGVGK